MAKKKVVKKTKTAPKIKRYKIKDTGTRGSVNYVQYYIDDYKEDRKRSFKILRDIENFANYKSRGMKDIKVLKDLPTWATIHFDDGKYISTNTIASGRDMDFDIYQEYAQQGRLRKIVGFSISFSKPNI
jgi:hypothetical protein